VSDLKRQRIYLLDGFWPRGQSPPRPPALKGRPQHLIEAAKRLTTRAPTGQAFAWPNVRPDARCHARPDVPTDPNQKPVHKTLIMESTVTFSQDGMARRESICKQLAIKPLAPINAFLQDGLAPQEWSITIGTSRRHPHRTYRCHENMLVCISRAHSRRTN